MGRRKIPRLPIQPLLDRLGTDRLHRAASLLGETDPRNFLRYAKDGGLPVHYADRLCVRLGWTPHEVWGQQYDAIQYDRAALADVRAHEYGRMTEAQFMAAVKQVVKLAGWDYYHTYDSRRSDPGFPDLVLARAPRLVFAELKTATGRLRPEQENWRDQLLACGQEWYLWRPGDLDTIVTLMGRDATTRDAWTLRSSPPLDAA